MKRTVVRGRFEPGNELSVQTECRHPVADALLRAGCCRMDGSTHLLERSAIRRGYAGQILVDGTRDDVLDNITHYWLTNTGVSSGRLYAENKLSFFGPKGVSIPVAVSVFPDELYQAPRSWVEKAYPKLIHYNRLPKGGHFAAWEQPKLLVDELRTGLRSLR